MEKVKVSKEAFEALVGFENTEKEGLAKLVKYRAKGFVTSYPVYTILNDFTFEEVLEIYKNGYELEEMPEEKLLRFYNMSLYQNDSYDKGYRSGVLKTLELLNIKIKGINK